jgi:hypothetical protein
MTGSYNMAGSKGGWTPTVPSSPCERINFRASINSPQAAILTPLELKKILDVKLQTKPTISVVVEYEGAIAGSLTGTEVSNIINCIQNGFEYSATIVAIDKGNYTVQVTSK